MLDFRSHREVEKRKDVQLGWDYYSIGAIEEAGELQEDFDFKSLLVQANQEELKMYLFTIYKQLPFHNEAYIKMFS